MSEPSSKVAPAGAQRLFEAIIVGPQRRRWPVLAVLVGIAATYLALRLVSSKNGTNVVTPFGVRTVRVGMTTKEVNRLLGRPIALGDAEPGLDCFRYGYPNFQANSFVVYSLCYEQSQLRSITENRYSAWPIAQDGTFAPSDGGATESNDPTWTNPEESSPNPLGAPPTPASPSAPAAPTPATDPRGATPPGASGPSSPPSSTSP